MDWFAHHDTWRWMNCIRHHLNHRNEASDSYVLGFGPTPRRTHFFRVASPASITSARATHASSFGLRKLVSGVSEEQALGPSGVRVDGARVHDRTDHG
jgi:hypothetical protein